MKPKYRLETSSRCIAIARWAVAEKDGKEFKAGEGHWVQFKWHTNVGQAAVALHELLTREGLPDVLDTAAILAAVQQAEATVLDVVRQGVVAP